MILFIFSVLFLVSLYNLSQIDRDGNLEVVFLDIGQGDSALIKTESGQNLLIDTGPNYITTQKFENSTNDLMQGLDAIILTHPDSDHVGGTQEAVDSLIPKKLILSTENNYLDYKNIETKQVYRVNNSDNIVLDADLQLEILSPVKNERGSDNHKSIVNRLVYGEFQFIFMGDADQETEREIVSSGYFDNNKSKARLKSILKVGHHGSNTSSGEGFLKKLKPDYCVISVGKDNKYKHPSAEALIRLEKYCKNIYRTDRDGEVSFKTDGHSLYIKNSK